MFDTNTIYNSLSLNALAKALALCMAMIPIVSAGDYIEPPMVNIPAGKYMMGNNSGDASVKPSHSVSINAFQMGKYSVTVAEFRKFAEDTGFNPEATCNDFMDSQGLKGPTYIGSGRWDKNRFSYSDYQPVTCISWQDAKAYAKWLNEKTGQEYRLPTEQEWEYSAKGNTTSRYFWGDDPDMNQACLYGNFADQTGEYFNSKNYFSNVGYLGHANCDDGEVYDSIVGLFRPNPFGLYDIVGNTSEYLDSCYFKDGYKERLEAELNTQNCEYITHRGGTWHYPPSPIFYRGRFKREGWSVGASMGFRLASNGQNYGSSESTQRFEVELNKAKIIRLATRPAIPDAPTNLQLIKLNRGERSNAYKLSWQLSEDPKVIGYDIYRSKLAYSHLFGDLYKKHYDKIETVNSSTNSIIANLKEDVGSFRVVAKLEKLESLPSQAAAVVKTTTVDIPGRLLMQKNIALENIYLSRWEAEDDKPELYYIAKTNKSFDNSMVTANFNIKVKKSAWYRLNYLGRTFKDGEFFKLWKNSTLLGKINFDSKIDDKTSSRHKFFLDKGEHKLQLSVLREGFDRWNIVWLEFTEM
jgi:formylglycine-generating enzyme required for sulfatase activity